MKLRLNKKTLAEMPDQVRTIVKDWKERHGKAFISVENTTKFYVNEDAQVTMINLHTGDNTSQQVAGDFAGFTRLSPTAEIPLPHGVVAIEKGFFLGVPFLNLYQGSNQQIAA